MSTTTNLGIGKVDSNLRQPEVPINAAFDYYDAILAGRLVKSVAGSADVTLTNDEARNRRIELTGAITANINLLFPVPGGSPAGFAARAFTILNNTTGAFTITVKTTAGGSTGVVVPQGYTMLLEHNGTNVYPLSPPMSATGLFVSRASVYHNANQSIADSTETALAFNSERIDTDSMHDMVTNNSRITIQKAGDYAAAATIAFDVNATGIRSVRIKLNGATILAMSQLMTVTVGSIITSITVAMRPYTFAAGDYLEVTVYQTSGGALNVLANGNYSPEFGVWRIG